MAYSNGSGGALTLPSPTHVHHADFSAAVRSLRRSMSRSPSRFNFASSPGPIQGLDANRTSTTTPPSPGRFGNPALAPHPTLQAASCPPPNFQSLSQTPLGTPSRTGVKLSVRSARPKPLATRPLTRTRTSPKSPVKRVFGGVSDAPNLLPTSTSGPESSGQENANLYDFTIGFGSATGRSRSPEKSSRHSMHLDVTGSSKQANSSRFLGISETFPSTSVSPMKRSDAMDSIGKGSPVAKRRSLHGISSMSNDFNVFDNSAASTQQSQSDESQDENSEEYQLASSPEEYFRGPLEPTTPTTPGTPTPTSIPKRTASLRKTTLQQRHGDGRSSFGRRAGEKQAAQLGNDPATPIARHRPRLSVDQYFPPEDRASPFTHASPLPNASVHPFRQSQPHPHPLSQFITQSNSSGSIKDSGSSGNIEQDVAKSQPSVLAFEKPRAPMIFAKPDPVINFSKSLPIGSSLPTSDRPMATPAMNAKPFQAAFASTGLISKMNRLPENGAPTQSGKPAVMPDTPCKKQPLMYFNTFPPSGSQSGSGGRRNSRARVDNPGTPLGSGNQTLRTNTFGKPRGGNIFESYLSGHGRKPSAVSMDDDNGASFVDDIPSTPTKTLFPRSSAKASAATPKVSRVLAAPVSAFAPNKAFEAWNPNSSPLSHAGSVSNSPRTPHGDMSTPESGGMSIGSGNGSLGAPATPTTQGRDSSRGSSALFGDRRTPQNVHAPKDVDESLLERFGRAEIIGKGEYSDVYRVIDPSFSKNSRTGFTSTPSRPSPASSDSERIFAVKRIKTKVTREAKLREVNTLKALAGQERIVQYRDSWWHGDFLYIQTDYYEEGNLAEFLGKAGVSGRLDDFRIWKILVDLAGGVQAIHDAGFMHLDLKPANVMIDSKGYLRICDFGLSHAWPAPKGIEGEGDREYISPDVLNGNYDKPADIFTLGLMMVEVATNAFLPDFGTYWCELREGRAAAMMTCPEQLYQARDVNGDPIKAEADSEEKDGAFGGPSSYEEEVLSGIKFDRDVNLFALSTKGMTHDPKNLFGDREDSYLEVPPSFMADPEDPGSLDKVIYWMISPRPGDRPTAQQILDYDTVRWVSQRRKAGATVYEGNFGPKSETASENDTEMMDV